MTAFHDRWLARVQKEISVEVSGAGVERVRMLRRGKGKFSAEKEPPLARRARRELEEYLRGKRKVFDLPIVLSSLPPFFQKILREAAKIPYGESRSYGWLAAQAGNPRAARAVGGAMHRNPVPILVPCHRVVAADGLGGFGSGLGLKRALLAHERRHK
jgi:methylated-DNA-[protein]-cysteine S-methyltransferase